MENNKRGKLAMRPVYLLLDTSKSMSQVDNSSGKALVEVLRSFVDELFSEINADPEVRNLNRFTVISFNTSASLVMDSITINHRTILPSLVPEGKTRFSNALNMLKVAIDHDFTKAELNGWRLRQPVAFLITDGRPDGEIDSERSRAWEELISMDDGKRPAFFTFPIPPFNGEAINEMSILPGVFFDNLSHLRQTNAMGIALKVIRKVTTQSTGRDIPTHTKDQWLSWNIASAMDWYNDIMKPAQSTTDEAAVDTVEEKDQAMSSVLERCENCQAESDWNSYITGISKGFKYKVDKLGPLEAARHFMSVEMRSGIMGVAWQQTLEANVLEYRYRCLWTSSDRRTARLRLLSIGVSQELLDAFEADHSRPLSRDCDCEFCPMANAESMDTD